MWNDLKGYIQMLVSGVRTDEEGQALVEYALILALVSIVAIAVLTSVGTGVINALTSVASQL